MRTDLGEPFCSQRGLVIGRGFGPSRRSTAPLWALLALSACTGDLGGGLDTSSSSIGGAGEGAGAQGDAGSTSSGDGGGGGSTPAGPERCGEGEWTCVPVEPTGAYGTRSFSVPAAQNWVNTGLYLEAGQTATISESGEWFVNPGTGNAIDHGPCVIGDLVARIGLHYKDDALTCVSGTATFVAPRSGILFVGGLCENDLGETYEARVAATGAKSVTVTSDGVTVPTVSPDEVSGYPFEEVGSGWVELFGEHVIVTLPTETALQDRADLADAVELLDQIYRLEEQLRGARPQHGQRIRFFPDVNMESLAYMIAGNPVRMVPDLVEPSFANRISQAAKPGVDIWGFAHELGHDFTFVGRLWWYQEQSLEAWPNLFSIYVFESLGVPLHPSIAGCSSSSPPVPYASWDPWSGLCFLMQFQFDHGWDFYETFFRELNAIEPSSVPSGPAAWHFNHDRFESISGVDATPRFEAWGVPHP